MSNLFYAKWWIVTRGQLAELHKYDEFMKANTKRTVDRLCASYLVAGLYCKYCVIVQDIGKCLDQISQPQKRITIRKLMDAAVIRLNELKEMLTQIDLSEIHYVDGSLIELKLVPYSIEILDPTLIYPRPENIEDMCQKIQKGARVFERPKAPTPSLEPVNEMDMLFSSKQTQKPTLEDVQQQVTVEETATTEEDGEDQPTDEQETGKKSQKKTKKQIKKFVPEKKVLTEEEIKAMEHKEKVTNAVKLIQIHERARQSRLYFLDTYNRKKETDRKDNTQQESNPEILNSSAVVVQKFCRGLATRNRMKFRENKRRLLIGMTEPSWKSKEVFDKLKQTVEMRRREVSQKSRELVKGKIDEKERILRVVGPGLMEDIGDEIREWFYQWYIRAKNFDKYPAAEKGGTILVVRGETFTPEEWIDEVERIRREKVKLEDSGKNKEKEQAEKKKKEMEKMKKEEEERKKKEAEEKKQKEKSEEFEFKFGDSEATAMIADVFAEYKELWGQRKIQDNPKNELYMDLITDKKCYEVQLLCRAKVDQLMRLELELLEAALAYDKAKAKGKKPKAPKKSKPHKGKKDKAKKDLTGNRKIEDLFQELVDAGIIHTYLEARLEDFKGDFSYNNWEKRQEDYDSPSALGDIRQVISLTCILPLGVEAMVKPKSVLIIGHKQCGKHLLANAIFTETKSVLFDLSAPILAGKYSGAQDTKLLVHLINKMSRLLQPSVIFFDGAEKPFYKKVPKQERDLEPKKLGKQLFKQIVKTITPEDRVIVLGISNQPWAANAQGLKKAFERIILIPRTDYGSIYLYWRELLIPYCGISRDIDLSCLTKLSTHYPLCQLKDIVQKVMTPRRIIQLRYNPLRQIELYNLLISHEYQPVPDKDYNKFLKFYAKTTLGSKRAKYMELAEMKREMEAKAAAKAEEKAAKKKK